MLANMDNSQQIIKGKRLNSLDFFRGATVAAMIWVNNPTPGNIYMGHLPMRSGTAGLQPI